MAIGFDAKVILLRAKQNPALYGYVIKILDGVLRKEYDLCIDAEVSQGEYEKNTQSKEIGKYLRIPVHKDKGEYKMVKYGSAKIEHEVFASSRYAFISMSWLNEYLAVWPNLHPRLCHIIPWFNDCVAHLAQYLSAGTRSEAAYLRATSFSRNDDLFYMFSNGRRREERNGKGALTDVKNLYQIDINNVMDHVDTNLSIFYAPKDFASIQKEIAEQEARYKAFMAQAENMQIPDQEDGTDMVKRFETENNEIMKALTYRLERVNAALKAPAIGTVVFLKLGKSPEKAHKVPESERHFGRDVPAPSFSV